ncbi:hypothetical protein Vadar_029829 [Vaccinium darrowii]|uniref:Uncharacterized protein n=1 Tax=Vaccinium darrowii TaxID=229202 RepID=A0ACB7YZH7_9ERIC|nr:hypothetical protein Vadar_029829 [Vaccinium darrowii]
MEYRILEINIISAKDLKKVNLIRQMHAYVIVSISDDPRASQQQRTAVDMSGNGNPTWNFPIKFVVDEFTVRDNHLTITFTIRSERSIGDKDIGKVHVPLGELMGSIEDGELQFVAYQVRKPLGRPKGELNFSYKWGQKMVGATMPPAITVNNADQEPVTAYPAQVGSRSAYAYSSPNGYPSGSAAAPPQYGAYPPQSLPPGYEYPPPQPGYGYPPIQQPQQPQKRFPILRGALRGILIGDLLNGFGHGGGGGGGCGGR